jgi:hypothetical protein
MSQTDRRAIPYLVDFMIAGSQVGSVEISYPMFHDIHFASKSSTIYILTPKLLELSSFIPPTMSPSDRRAILYLYDFSPSVVTDSQVPGFTKVSNHICWLWSLIILPDLEALSFNRIYTP